MYRPVLFHRVPLNPVRRVLLGLVCLLAAALLVACSGGAAAAPSVAYNGDAALPDAPAAAPAEPGPVADNLAPDHEAAPAQDDGPPAQAGAPAAPVQPAPAQRKIIKNGTLRMAVADPDVAVDRITQIAADAGGYLLSSKVWMQEENGQPQKYATIGLSVPSDQFEPTLNRLRGIAVRVLDETASGEDVTAQFVDLESQLRNQQATRDRIRGFLDKAQSVEEALKVNAQLADIEAQIEQTQGRMNYLAGRSAYSTIAVDVQPDLTPATPTPTPAPLAWNPNTTFERAGSTLGRTLQILADILIWFTVVLLPFLLVFGVVGWVVYRVWPGKR